MKTWSQRAEEVAYLFNPAFCGEILRRCIKEYSETSSNPMPYALIFLALPLILHKTTRESVNPRTRQLHLWLQANPEVRIEYAEHARRLVPITHEALTFLLQVKAISIDEDAQIGVLPYRQRNLPSQRTGEIAECYTKAAVIGRWFARAGTSETVYTMLGVKP